MMPLSAPGNICDDCHLCVEVPETSRHVQEVRERKREREREEPDSELAVSQIKEHAGAQPLIPCSSVCLQAISIRISRTAQLEIGGGNTAGLH
jgi:hypothetical protein